MTRYKAFEFLSGINTIAETLRKQAKLTNAMGELARLDHGLSRFRISALDLNQLSPTNSNLSRASLLSSFSTIGILPKLTATSEFERSFGKISTDAHALQGLLREAELVRSIERTVSSLASVLPRTALSEVGASLLGQSAKWNDLVSKHELLFGPALSWANNVAALSRLHSTLPRVAVDALVRPLQLQTEHAISTSRLLSKATSGIRTERLIAAMQVVDAQVADQIDTTEALLKCQVAPRSARTPSPIAAAPLKLHVRQRRELVTANGETSSIDTLTAQSDAFTTQRLCARVFLLIAQINSEVCVAGASPVFKLTNHVLEASATLPWLDVDGALAFGRFVDALYFVLYEAAGKDHLRFLRGEGGPLDSTDVSVVFRLKHLRNKWLRHDPEHGDSAAIRRSYRDLAAALEAAGLSHLPRTVGEFRLLQRHLLDECITLLELLLQRVRE